MIKPGPWSQVKSSSEIMNPTSFTTSYHQVALVVKNPPAEAGDKETWVHFLGWEDPLEEGMATCSSILTWRTPWTEQPGRLLSMGLQRVGRHCSDLACVSIQNIYSNADETKHKPSSCEKMPKWTQILTQGSSLPSVSSKKVSQTCSVSMMQ